MHLGPALDLIERLPQVGDALRRGWIDLARARVICESTCHLEEAEASRVADAVLEQAENLTTGQLGAGCGGWHFACNPGRPPSATRLPWKRRVMCLPNADGTADLVACNLPVERAAACMRSLDTEAHEAKRSGDPRSIDQLRTDILLDRLDVDRSTTTRRGVVDLHIDLTTLAGLDANPAEIPGFGADRRRCRPQRCCQPARLGVAGHRHRSGQRNRRLERDHPSSTHRHPAPLRRGTLPKLCVPRVPDAGDEL
jgi:Domain of unknown function (DUF222)